MTKRGLELLVVMPAYNEEASIRKVILEWHKELSGKTQDFLLLAINDGSKDGTGKILDDLQQAEKIRLKVIHQENVGHGQACLRGYRWAVDHNMRYVLQLDSDGQCDPRFFQEFWVRRSDYDVIYGKRFIRDDGWRRAFASWILKMILLAHSRALCVDANVPYRLMQTHVLESVLAKIPADFHLANVGLAVLLKKKFGVRHAYVPIHFRKRYGGEPSVRFNQFTYRARQLIRQLSELD